MNLAKNIFFTLFIVSFLTGVHAEYPIYQDELLTFEDEHWIEVQKNSRDHSTLIRHAVEMAKSSYDHHSQSKTLLELRDVLGCHLLLSLQSEGLVCARFQKDLTEVKISFRGTVHQEDWKTNLKANKTSGAPLQLPGEVHSGFLKRFLKLAPGLDEALQDILQNASQNVQFLVSGHSLGGALATLAAVKVKQDYPSSLVNLVTFASPRVVDTTSAIYIERLLEGSIFRIWRNLDLVSKVSLGLPLKLYHWLDQALSQMPYLSSLRFLGYRHVGRAYNISALSWSPLHNHGVDGFLQEAHQEEKVPVHQDTKGFWDLPILNWLKS